MEQIITQLASASDEIRLLEEEAKRLLYECGDQQGYRDRLRQKAILLSGLADAVEEAVTDLAPQVQTMIQGQVGALSFDADRALRLDSIFYMAVLLYPEDHQEGGENDLEKLIAHLRDCRQPSA